jgi:hypothetical protein
LNFLPQCDAALFVVSADPPITEVERQFLQAAREKTAKLCYVMNKVDYLSQSELSEATAFFDKTLKDAGLRGEIFPISAKKALQAKIQGDSSLWRESGVEKLHCYLLEFLWREKTRILQAAIASKASEALADAAMAVELQRRAVELSREELERRIGIFDAKVKEIEKEKIRAADLLAGDRKRTVELLEERAATLRRDGGAYLVQMVLESLEDRSDPAEAERLARERMAAAIPEYFAASLGNLCGELSHALRQAVGAYQERLDALIGALRSTAAELFDIPCRSTASDGGLEEVHKPYWVTQNWSALISPVPEGFFERFLPAKLRKARLKARLTEEVKALVTRNVENLRWASRRNLDEAFRRFAAQFDERLKETAQAARAAMAAARSRRQKIDGAAAPELERLARDSAKLAALRAAVSRYVRSI